MLQVMTSWNLSRPDTNDEPNFENIMLRGDDQRSFITGEFSIRISDKIIKPLSVSSIADAYCPTQRDFYFQKGKNKPNLPRGNERWGQKVGYLVEEAAELLLLKYKKSHRKKYGTIRALCEIINDNFRATKAQRIKDISLLETGDHTVRQGDTEWLLTLIGKTLSLELAHRHLGNVLRDDDSIHISDIKIKQECEIEPHPNQIGISSPSTPDFIIPSHNLIGDIKSGLKFEPHYQLTCAGYALAYENAHPKTKINWGAIYFFPTRNPSLYVRPITFPNVFFFPIDDPLREWFLKKRDEKFMIALNDSPPDFPPESDRRICLECKFKTYCESKGLKLGNVT